MTPVNDPPIVRVRQSAVDAWAKYMSLWRAGRGGIAVALLLPCCLCSLCGSIVMMSVDPPPPTATPRPTLTAGPTSTLRPTVTPRPPMATDKPATATDEPATEAPATAVPTTAPTRPPATPVPVLPTEAPPATAAPQIQPLFAAPPPAAAPAGPNCVGARKCDTFGSQREAQAYWEACGHPARMDADHDNRVCETLP